MCGNDQLIHSLSFCYSLCLSSLGKWSFRTLFTLFLFCFSFNNVHRQECQGQKDVGLLGSGVTGEKPFTTRKNTSLHRQVYHSLTDT